MSRHVRRWISGVRNGVPPVSEDELIALTDVAAEADAIEGTLCDMIASALALDLNRLPVCQNDIFHLI